MSGLAGVPDWHDAEQALAALPAGERVAVRRAVALGRKLEDVRLAQIAVAYARFSLHVPERSRNRVVGLVLLGLQRGWALIAMALIVALLLRDPLFLVGLAAILVVGLAINTRSVLRHAAQAEEVNLDFLRQAR